MLSAPEIVTRPEQPIIAVITEVSQPEIFHQAPPLIGEVLDWLRSKGGSLAGVPFFNYFEFLPNGRMKMQIGAPLAAPLKGEGKFISGTLPGGRYASLTYTGPYSKLYDANVALEAWMDEHQLVQAGIVAGGGLMDATHLEIYHQEPGQGPGGEPVTEVAFRLRD